MKKILSIALALTMLLALGVTAFAADKDPVADRTSFVMGIDPEYPPFSYLGDDGEYTGFDVEVCQAVCDLLGWKLEVFGVNWDEKLVQLDSMECDCVWSGMTILDSMKEAGYVISEPYYDNTQVLVVKADSGFASSEDLAGKVVAVQLGTSGEALLNGDLSDLAATFDNVITCDSFLKCFTELEGNAVDAVFVDLPVAARGLLPQQLPQQTVRAFLHPEVSFTARVLTEKTSSSNVVLTPQHLRSSVKQEPKSLKSIPTLSTTFFS